MPAPCLWGCTPQSTRMGTPWRRLHRRRMLRTPVKRSLTSGLDARLPEVMHMPSTATTVRLAHHDTRSPAGPLGLLRRFPAAALAILTSGLPRLQARWSALGASVFIGVLEGLFHLPLFFQPGSDQAAAGLPVFVIGSIAGAIVFSWVFNNTLGSLLLVQLFHIFANTWITLFSAAPADNVTSQWLFNGLLVGLAAIVLIACGARRLSRRPASELPVMW